MLLTSHLPKPRTEADTALRAAGPGSFFDALEMLSPAGLERLRAYAAGKAEQPLPGFWTAKELARR